MSDELKPCPFCGENADGEDYRNNKAGWWIECCNCGARSPIIANGFRDLAESEALARAEWNRRTDVETGEDYDKSFAELTVAYNLKCAEADALRAERDAALAEAARYKALWDSVPWYAAKESADQLFRVRDFQSSTREYVCMFREWVYAHAPQSQKSEA